MLGKHVNLNAKIISCIINYAETLNFKSDVNNVCRDYVRTFVNPFI